MPRQTFYKQCEVAQNKMVTPLTLFVPYFFTRFVGYNTQVPALWASVPCTESCFKATLLSVEVSVCTPPESNQDSRNFLAVLEVRLFRGQKNEIGTISDPLPQRSWPVHIEQYE